MSTGRLADPVVSDLFDALFAETWYSALVFDNPFATDPLTVEVSGGSYSRSDYTKERPAFNLIRNTNLLVWRNLPAGTHIAGYALFDSDVNGVMRAAVVLDDPIELPSGGTHSLAAAQLQVGLDVVLGP